MVAFDGSPAARREALRTARDVIVVLAQEPEGVQEELTRLAEELEGPLLLLQ